MYPRVSNRPYDADRLSDFQSQFTVMKYRDSVVEEQVWTYQEMRADFEHLYPQCAWVEMEKKMFAVIRRAFEAAKRPGRSGRPVLQQAKNACAIYGVDFLIDSQLRPHLLEFTMTPDTQRLCGIVPGFYGDVLRLVLNGDKGEFIEI
jgi:hypothetical protein